MTDEVLIVAAQFTGAVKRGAGSGVSIIRRILLSSGGGGEFCLEIEARSFHVRGRGGSDFRVSRNDGQLFCRYVQKIMWGKRFCRAGFT